MTEDVAKLAQYLRALSVLNSSHIHDQTSLLTSLALKAALAREMLRHTAGIDPRARARLDEELTKLETKARGVIETAAFLLRQTRVDVGQEDFDLADLLREIEALMLTYTRDRKLEWMLEGPGTPLEVSGDRGEARRMLLTSIVERAQAMHKGGRLAVRWVDGGSVTIRVEGREPGAEADHVDVHLPVEPRR